MCLFCLCFELLDAHNDGRLFSRYNREEELNKRKRARSSDRHPDRPPSIAKARRGSATRVASVLTQLSSKHGRNSTEIRFAWSDISLYRHEDARFVRVFAVWIPIEFRILSGPPPVNRQNLLSIRVPFRVVSFQGGPKDTRNSIRIPLPGYLMPPRQILSEAVVVGFTSIRFDPEMLKSDPSRIWFRFAR